MNTHSRNAARRRPATRRTAPPDMASTVRRVREALQDTDRIERLARTFRALGDAGRSKLILALSMGEMCVGDLAAALGASPSATSHQLRILRDLDLVRVRRKGRSHLYVLNEAGFGLCSPRVCHAWRETLGEGSTVAIESLRGSRRRHV
ncbi:MAG: metalloregulator ArsR/SmtB family transcription factor [Candidatus Eisenbacteria bacterium]